MRTYISREYITELQAIHLLRALKKYFTLSKLSAITRIDETIISKYINGHIIPHYGKAKSIITALLSHPDVNNYLNNIIDAYLRANINRYPDILPLINSNVDLIIYLTLRLIEKLINIKITRLITVEGGGLFIASIISSYLSVNLSYCIRDKYIPDSYVEYIHKENPFYSSFLSLVTANLSSKDYVLIVDDVIVTGETIKTVYRLIRRTNAKIIGAAVLFVSNTEIVKTLSDELNMDIIYEFSLF